MKRGISLILIIVMVLIVAILSYVCVLVINNNSSFCNIKELKNVKSQIQENVNDLIYGCEMQMYQDVEIKSGYIIKDAEDSNLPKIESKDFSQAVNYEFIIPSDVEIPDNVKIYLDEDGTIHLKYLFLDI